MTCLLFCDHLDTRLAERNFSLEFYAFVILKNLLTFSVFWCKLFLLYASFLRAFFHNMDSSIFKNYIRCLVSNSCFCRDSYFGISIYNRI